MFVSLHFSTTVFILCLLNRFFFSFVVAVALIPTGLSICLESCWLPAWSLTLSMLCLVITVWYLVSSIANHLCNCLSCYHSWALAVPVCTHLCHCLCCLHSWAPALATHLCHCLSCHHSWAPAVSRSLSRTSLSRRDTPTPAGRLLYRCRGRYSYQDSLDSQILRRAWQIWQQA